jgi:transcriptional regulator with GAF, ATPase, and Fis domain
MTPICQIDELSSNEVRMVLSSRKDDYDFFRQAVHSISSSLDLAEAMVSTFHFLRQHFPLEAMSLHTLAPRLSALHLLFLVVEGRFHYMDELVPLGGAALEYLQEFERNVRISSRPHSELAEIPKLHSLAISPYLPQRDRAYLVAMLSTEQGGVGHLALIGPRPECFGAEHERKLEILIPALSLAMINLLRHREVTELQSRLEAANRGLAAEVHRLSEAPIIGAKHGLRRIMDAVGQLAGRDVPVLILGETGTGKELIANVIQRISSRHDAPYIKVNCGAVPDTLIDSELFGHEKGAFTGAFSGRPGRFEQAHGGTLFLDEVGDMPLQAQTRLLRVLQDGIVQRVGSTKVRSVDVRIIAATHRNLEAMVREGSFREDLYYRLNVFPLRMPPLRVRTEDIPSLIHYFIGRTARRLRLGQTPQLDADSLPKLLAYLWPGNVRELENLIERALILDPQGLMRLHLLLPSEPSSETEDQVGESPRSHQEADHEDKSLTRRRGGSVQGQLRRAEEPARDAVPTLDQVMTEHILQALRRCGGRIHGPGGTAEMLGVNPNTLRKRMDKLGIPYGRRRPYL